MRRIKYFLRKIISKVNKAVGILLWGLTSFNRMVVFSIITVLMSSSAPLLVAANDTNRVTAGNFGLPGIIDLPTARRFPDGELVITHQNHEYIFMNGISFQALPRLGLSFRYGGHGREGRRRPSSAALGRGAPHAARSLLPPASVSLTYRRSGRTMRACRLA